MDHIVYVAVNIVYVMYVANRPVFSKNFKQFELL